MRALHAQALACAFVMAMWAAGAAGADEAFQLDEVIVSAPSADATLRAVPHGVSVITADDIARSSAQTVGELVSREAGLNLQSYFGRDKGATIDMRGLGAGAASNVRVLVDGVRLNADDLSGADLSAVALSQVERIEVLRGAGAVRYGDGAVGGVINILTRRPRHAPLTGQLDGQLDLRAGAWGTREARFRASGGNGPLAATVNLSRLDRDGYRENDRFEARDSAIELSLLPDGAWSFIELSLRAARHIDRYRLPGPVSAQAFAAGRAERRASTASPLDGGNTDDRTLGARLRLDLGAAGQVELQADRRDRDNPYLIGVQPAVPLADQQSAIESSRRELQARYDLGIDAFGRRHDFSAGYGVQSSDYLRREGGRLVLDSSQRRSGELDSRAGYVEGVLRLGAGLSLNAGWRGDRARSNTLSERYSQQCRYIFIPFPVVVPGSCVDAFRPTAATQALWRNHASELGASWQISPTVTLFASSSRHFRNPNIDELALASPDLRPQEGRTKEAGLRLRAADALELSGTLYRMQVEHEIFFDSASGQSVNRNYERPTERTGVELDLRWRARPSLLVAANLALVRPRFEGIDADVPLVPRRTLNARVEWSQTEALRWSIAARHVGRRFDGNDLDNRSFAALPSYTVFDLALRHDFGDAQLSAGVSNLFDKVYSTLAYSNTYYPMPGRSAWVGLLWRFD